MFLMVLIIAFLVIVIVRKNAEIDDLRNTLDIRNQYIINIFNKYVKNKK